MEHQYKVCCGLDVHKKLLVACLRTGRKTEIRECGASTREILERINANVAPWKEQVPTGNRSTTSLKAVN